MTEYQKKQAEAEADAEIDRQHAVADQLLEVLMNKLHENEPDPGGVIYGMWITMIHYLVHCGWNAEDLKKDVDWHVNNELPWTRSTHPKGGHA